MNPWLVVSAVLLAGPAAFAANPSPQPSPELGALPLKERNLAVYDAFWMNIEQNHYDPQMLSRAEVRSLREQWRRKAAAIDLTANLYGQVFSAISNELPESHVHAQLPPVSAERNAGRRYSKSPEELQRLAELLFAGPGFDETTMRRGSRKIRVVTEVQPDSPAEEAGIRPGWRVVSYNSTADALRKTVQFTGEFLPLDASAALAWERGELPADIPDRERVLKISYAHRALSARRPVESRRVGNGVSYLRFDGFGDDEFMRPVHQALREAGAEGLIIDLRWNAGGVTQQAQKVAGVLLGGGVNIGYLKHARGSEALLTTKPARRYEGPVVLLVGPASGSASEILAAAIQDHRRGKLVGRMTNGSLLSAEVFPLPDGGHMSVPTRDYRSSRSRRLEGVGLTPDIRVLPTLEDVRAGRDPTLERAVQVLGPGNGGGKARPEFRHRRGELFPPI